MTDRLKHPKPCVICGVDGDHHGEHFNVDHTYQVELIDDRSGRPFEPWCPYCGADSFVSGCEEGDCRG